jgi:DNA invertase Pin-like site-specific DNA recombinase
LEAQDQAIDAYVKAFQCDLIGTYTEIESATHHDVQDRPQLIAAIGHAKRSNAILVIAKLDRLVRSTIAMAAIKSSRVKFVACDQPAANELTLDILVAVAADEARKISQRTKDALAAYKARGGLLGGSREECRNLTQEGRQRGAKASGKTASRLADEAYADIVPMMKEWRAAGLSQQKIADRLNDAGHTTRQGKQWSYIQVAKVLARFND